MPAMTKQRPNPPGPWWLSVEFLALVMGALFVVAAPLFMAYNEAASFNRFTVGPKATIWDALFVELRIEAQR
jgi:hypothetical protein